MSKKDKKKYNKVMKKLAKKNKELRKNSLTVVIQMIEQKRGPLYTHLKYLVEIGVVKNFEELFTINKDFNVDILKGLIGDIDPSVLISDNSEEIIINIAKTIFEDLKLKNDFNNHNTILLDLVYCLGSDNFCFSQVNDMIIINERNNGIASTTYDKEVRVLPLLVESENSISGTDHYVFLVSTDDPASLEDVAIQSIMTKDEYTTAEVIRPLVDHIVKKISNNKSSEQ